MPDFSEYGRPLIDLAIEVGWQRRQLEIAMGINVNRPRPQSPRPQPPKGQGGYQPSPPASSSPIPPPVGSAIVPFARADHQHFIPSGLQEETVRRVRCGGFEQKMFDGRMVESACLEQGNIPPGQRWFYCHSHSRMVPGYPGSEPPPAPPSEEPSRKLWLEDSP